MTQQDKTPTPIEEAWARILALGISKADVTRALGLVKDLRTRAVMESLDPRAVRIALVFADAADFHVARKRLDLETLTELEAIGGLLLMDQVRRELREGKGQV